MTVRCTTEEARAFSTAELGTGQPLPQDLKFDNVPNHFAAAVLWAAAGEPEQVHNVGKLYAIFKARCPDSRTTDHLPEREVILKTRERYLEAKVSFMNIEDEARLRERRRGNPDVLDDIQWTLANEWKFDKGPKHVYAVNGLGTVASVYTMGGRVTPDHRAWPRTLKGIQGGISRTFSS